MRPEGAQAQAENTQRYLNESRRGPLPGRWKGFAAANSLACRELEMVKIWVESLKDLKMRDDLTTKERERQLILEIRERIHKIHGVQPREASSEDAFFRRMEREDVIL